MEEWLAKRMQDLSVSTNKKPVEWELLRRVSLSPVEMSSQKIDEFEADSHNAEEPLRFEGIHCPYFYEDIRNREDLNIDLMEGFDMFVRKDMTKLQLGEGLLWLEEQLRRSPGASLNKVLNDADFFMSRGVLRYVATAPFTGLKSWTTVWFKWRGVIFAFSDDSCDQVDYEQYDYMAHKFHQHVTCSSPEVGLDSPFCIAAYADVRIHTKPDTARPIDSHKKFMAMFHSSFDCNGHTVSCVYSAGVDCIGQDGHLIELKTEKVELMSSPGLAKKYAHWWMQAKLSGATELIVGLKSELDTSKIVAVKSVDLQGLQRASNGTHHWKEQDFLTYLHYFLSEVKAVLDDPSHTEGTILVAELTSNDASTIAMHIEPMAKSKYHTLFEELKEQLSKHM